MLNSDLNIKSKAFINLKDDLNNSLKKNENLLSEIELLKKIIENLKIGERKYKRDGSLKSINLPQNYNENSRLSSFKEINNSVNHIKF